MILIDCIDIDKAYGEKVILKNVNFSINDGEKIAIIGKNGQGKSTFLKIITKEIEPDNGRVLINSSINFSMLSQSINIDYNLSVDEYIKLELGDIFNALSEYNEINSKLSTNPNDKELLQKQQILFDLIESKDAWSIDSKINRALKEFELSSFINRNLASLSGGELRRLSLACMLLKSPDVLILDEPTNHLDVTMCKYLEDMLKASKKCVIFISHDRYFIDNIASKCVEIEDAKLREFEGGYSNYLQAKARLLESLNKSYETLVKQLKSEEEWLRRGVKARLKRNEGRKERIFKMREEAKKNPSILNRLRVELARASDIKSNPLIANKKKMLFELHDISLTLGEKLLFKPFNARILQGEKIAIVGKNGCGKSSFLQILLEKLRPSSGFIKKGEINIGYFDQKKSDLKDDETLIEYFCPNGGDTINVKGSNMHVYGYLKHFLFPKEQLTYKIGSLSGGEKSRVALAKLFTKDYEVLILDEPTNDLDIATINILEQYLMDFKGALIFVSHDRYFTDRLATKLFAFSNQSIEIETMKFSELLELNDELSELNSEIENDKEKPVKVERKKSVKLSYKQNKILEEHPVKIEEIEKEIRLLNEYLSDPTKYEKYGILALNERLENLNQELELLENEYYEVLELTERLENVDN
ncbi:ABC-F family ATP-binding cassette domain-containing protein [Campylobacter sp. RM12640]|uniref:ribosomal protection-like ABC-F family protein n=1 Tax=unclassified Campylobacter TaxID=2593542 RepID=UPI001BD97307|nr:MULTISPECIES: ABC-F family ATP-binding cassette domain-containing protein [unclassified Campylobacter]MBT0879301.1 ATP-binding cassette domain-containing protein [Campylobacter sp. 2018MI01]MBZ7982072.1 ABC-F family ATP-binding cassette domain-containing protein [Campylobacter sp. RM12640]MBZ7988872.1 ABC-F family ATP-binding cassette domain-containing protein [Campylobacter sp. RM12635]ULO03421.1 ABC transporter, ATP-binding protein [Campylobacter sp. RM12651]